MWGDGMYNFVDIYIVVSSKRNDHALPFTNLNNNGIKRVKNLY